MHPKLSYAKTLSMNHTKMFTITSSLILLMKKILLFHKQISLVQVVTGILGFFIPPQYSTT